VRNDHITATDVAAIMGTSPWKTPADIYLEKCLPMDPIQPSPAMVWGTLMEPVLLQFAAGVLAEHYSEPDLKITRVGIRRTHANGVMSCTLDGLIKGHADAVEAKTHAAIHGNVDLSAWGEPWTDDIPEWYRDQVCAQMACASELQRVWVVLSVGRMMPTFYCLQRQHLTDRIAEIEQAVCDFWDDYIVPGIPPSASQPSLEVVRRINVPINDAAVVELPDNLVQRRQKANGLKNRLTKIQEGLDAQIRMAMVGASRATTPGGHRVTLSSYHRKGYSVEATEVSRMNVLLAG
jgi:putative phage-type endonuclease